MDLVKVRYFIEALNDQLSTSEYTYYAEDDLQVGDVVMAPVKNGQIIRAQVSTVNVAPAEIEAFKDKVKTIPAQSKVVGVVPDDIKSEEAVHLFGVTVSQVILDELPAPVTTLTIPYLPDEQLKGMVDEANKMLHFAEQRIIVTPQDAKAATNDLSIIAQGKKEMEARRKEVTAPIREKLDTVNDLFKSFMHPIEQADKITRDKLTLYQRELTRQREEAERIEVEKIRLAQEEAAFKQGEITVDLTPIEKPEPIQPIRTDMGTAGMVDNWTFEITDFASLPDDYKLPNEQMLRSAARTYKDKRIIPGVRFYNNPQLRVTSRRRE